MTVITRKQYMDAEDRGQAHRDYYAQFVTDATIGYVLSRLPEEKLAEAFAEDPALNSIPLAVWGRMTWVSGMGDTFRTVLPFNREALKQADSFGVTRSDLVCIAKAAARIIVERSALSNNIPN